MKRICRSPQGHSVKNPDIHLIIKAVLLCILAFHGSVQADNEVYPVPVSAAAAGTGNDFISDAVIVRAKREKGETITTTISQEEIKRMPGTAGDTLRAVQSLPGVTVANDFVGQLTVQGGGPFDNLYLLDNIPWPVPFHLGGILSTVNSSLLSSVDLNSAGFSARWGNIMGAVLDAKTRPGSKDRFRLSADASLIASQLLCEGPLGPGDLSFTVSGRRSYIDLLARAFESGVNGGSGRTEVAMPLFWDAGGTLDFTAGPGNRFHALAAGSYDNLGFNTDALKVNGLPSLYQGDFITENSAFTSGFSWTGAAGSVFISMLTPYYYFTSVLNSVGTGMDIDLRRDFLGLKEEASWRAGDTFGIKHELGFGGMAEIAWERMTSRIYASIIDPKATGYIYAYVRSSDVNLGAYAQDSLGLTDSLRLTAGLRYDRSSRENSGKLLPRLGLEWGIDAGTKIRAAWGQYSQLPGPLESDEKIGNSGLRPNSAEHAVISLEKTLLSGLEARISAYYKTYADLVIFMADSSYYLNAGTGRAKGLEFLLRWHDGDRFFAWISYTLSKSERFGPPSYKWVSYQYDEPHNLTLVASHKIIGGLNLGAKLHYATGPLEKRIMGSYRNAFYLADGVYSDTNENRLEDYLRLDLRVDYSWRFDNRSLKVYAEVINALNRANPQGLVYPDGQANPPETINNMPILPYAGLEAEF